MAAQSVPSAGEHVSDVLALLSGDLDALAAVDLHDVAVAALPELLESLTVLQRRLDAQVLATVETFDASGAWQRDGAASARAWMRANLRQSPGAARAAVVTARRLRDLPAMETALRAGEISREHVAVVTRAMEVNPARRDTIAAAEPVFAEAAKDLDPNQLARAVTRWTHIVDPLGALEAEKAIHAQRFLSASRTFEGAVKIDGLLGPEQGASVMTALEAMATADYRQTRSEAVDSDGGVEGLTAGQRRADALVELSRRFLDSGEAPEIAGMRPHLHLTMPLETLTAEHRSHRTRSSFGVGSAWPGAPLCGLRPRFAVAVDARCRGTPRQTREVIAPAGSWWFARRWASRTGAKRRNRRRGDPPPGGPARTRRTPLAVRRVR